MEKGPSFIRGLVTIMGLYLLAIPAMIIPLVGPVLAITLIPYFASAFGSRFTHPNERLPLAFTCSMIWSSIVTFFSLFVMTKLASISPMGFNMDGYVWALILVFWIFNTAFTVLGAINPWRDPFRNVD